MATGQGLLANSGPSINWVSMGNESQDKFYGGELNKLMGKNRIKVKQQMRWGEVLTCGACDLNNYYTVLDENDSELFRMMEDSDCCNRCFCGPFHTYQMRVVPPGAKEPLETDQLLSFREGCCSKWLCCFTCGESCQNVAGIYATGPGNGSYSIEEKICNGCHVELVLYYTGNGQKQALAIIHGPTFFGGLAELCNDADFYVTTCDEKAIAIRGAPGDVAKIRKKKPEGCCGCIKEACTDVDNYEIDVNTNCSWNNDPHFLGVLLGALFQLDFMFFDKDRPYITCDQDNIYITICNYYCYGCICPCYIPIPIPKNN